MNKHSVSSVIIDALVEHKIKYLFCLPGVQNDDFFNVLFDKTNKLKPIHTRHEQGAAYMALGAAMATGTPQAYCVVPGPGFLNTTAALSTALAVNAPVLSLTGQIPSGAIGKGHGLLHEIPDQLSIARGLTKWAARINEAEDASELTCEAFKQLTTGRVGPISIEVPQNIWAEKATPSNTYISKTLTPIVDEDKIMQAAKILAKAERPLIFVGSGAINSAVNIKKLAELLTAPVISFRNGKGILDSRHPLACGMPEGHALWRNTDAVLAVGTRLQPQRMTWGTDKELTIIHIDIDQDELGRNGPTDIEIFAHSEDSTALLIKHLELINKHRSTRLEEISEIKANVIKEYSVNLAPQLAYLQVIRKELPEDGIFIDELTQIGYVSRFAFPVYKPRTFLSTGYQGTLGWGLATGLGAKIVKPEVPVISISGDGGFMYNIQELATAVHHNIPLISIVFNDGAFGNVKRMQEENFSGRTIATDLTNPDFKKLAETFGAKGLKARSPNELQITLKEAIKESVPTVIEVNCGAFPNPWQYILFPKIRG
ncbi:MAG: hypothetical protein CMM58_08505 [Rhodospirillaceae bacterium]|nr:hypothetical protein [Rhodospirillaceae bacterium]